MSLQATSELEAVNTMLATLGEAPVNQLDSGLDVADAALRTLHEVSRTVQTIGWDFNTEEDVTLSVSSEGHATLSGNTLSVDSNGQNLVQRGTKLYDKANHTYTFSTGPTVTVVYGLDYEELPEPVRQYITIRAARVFQARELGSTTLHKFTERDEMNAWVALSQFESNSADVSIFDSTDMQVMNDRSAGSFIDVSVGAYING